jgi:hypothetical protein
VRLERKQRSSEPTSVRGKLRGRQPQRGEEKAGRGCRGGRQDGFREESLGGRRGAEEGKAKEE